VLLSSIYGFLLDEKNENKTLNKHVTLKHVAREQSMYEFADLSDCEGQIICEYFTSRRTEAQ